MASVLRVPVWVARIITRTCCVVCVVGVATLILLAVVGGHHGDSHTPIPVDITCPTEPGGDVLVKMCVLDRATYMQVSGA